MYNEYASEALQNLQKGAFLSVSNEEMDNTMTISWGSIGFYWGKPMFMVLVRYSRHTYTLLENSQQFSVSIPIDNDLKEALAKCGSLSGKDVNKWEVANITPISANNVNTKLVEECSLHYECKVVARMPLEKDMVSAEVFEKWYNNDNNHVLYYGEILGTYLK
ncbi:MAG: hypothetical protein BEN19_02020 [Epulopiscium sp. Nuni2H_MBin003]|nr:MAG: hypothetical protein BEN19_02020 [Epulopiscium sp. Nuni2H_MBin003]